MSDFDLRPASNQAELMDRVLLLDAQLPKLGVQNLLAQSSRHGTAMQGRGAICNPGAVDVKERTLAPVYSFCFDSADSGTNGGNVEWTPQGITTVADAQDDQAWGTAQPLIVSWYNDDSEYVKGARVTFINPDTGDYQHVLLAYPYINDSGNATYMSLRTKQDSSGSSLHAGGIAWYGNYLYVADTRRGFRVFDMRYIFDLQAAGSRGDTTDKTRIGRHDGVFYGHGYRYVMPEVAAWTSAAGEVTDPSVCTGTGSPHFSFVGLDRTGTDHLTTGEYCNGSTVGRVATWPLNGSNGQPSLAADGRWHAASAFRLPVSNIQGAVSHGDTWYVQRSHGTDVPDQNDNGDLLRTSAPAGASTGVLSSSTRRVTAAVGPEDLSYWSGFRGFGDVLFTVTEHPGQRMVYATPVSAFG
ncbi:hypothetical protein CIK06_10065 [Plantactinospora sp. KBS50]|nr:hypothetical protein CIK06_10065 [Plantactinospora sp. KBS50]